MVFVKSNTSKSCLIIQTCYIEHMSDNSTFDIQNKNMPTQNISGELISNIVPDIIAEVDTNKKYVWLNKAGTDFFGEDAIGKEASDFFVGDQNVYEVVDQIFKGYKELVYLESWQLRKDGQKRLLAWWCRYLKDSQGNITGALSSAHDITDRIKADESVKKTNLFLQNTIDFLPIRIFWKDINLKYLGCNIAFAKDSGNLTPDELIGKDDYDMAWKDQAEAYRSDDSLVIKSGNPKLNYEEEQTSPSGAKIYLLTNKVPLKNNLGEIIGVLGTYDNITERKHREQELIKARKDLEEKISELEKMNSLMVNRELKMTDLKKEIEDLKKPS